MLLDTSCLVDVLRGDPDARELLEEIDNGGVARVSTVTIMELWEGIHLADATATQRRAVETLLEEIDELPFRRASAKRAGELVAALHHRGEPIDDDCDVMIAATALTEGLTLYTRNVRHFDRVEGLDVRSY